jgi:hypothetical protein
MNNDMKKIIQENLIKAIINILAKNNNCKDCPLAKSIVDELPNQILQDLYKR